jgi:DNA-binding CsgD family transcriptional regulator
VERRESRIVFRALTRAGLPELRGLAYRAAEKEIAAALDLSPATVHDYVKALYRRFRVSGRAELSAHFRVLERRAGLRLKGGPGGLVAQGALPGTSTPATDSDRPRSRDSAARVA